MREHPACYVDSLWGDVDGIRNPEVWRVLEDEAAERSRRASRPRLGGSTGNPRQ